ncbi:MAG: AbrB/MazE/SpoVT family DNA-binding domain-containing protein [Planctomycetes bacterium]|nr:AbrB/MazE/SpoVT family DNA-binding domain-containing protein [Planctomycetota bacterium]
MTATELTLRRIGNSLGVILPAELLAELGIAKEGDKLLLTSGADGELRLRVADEGFQQKLAALRDTMQRYKNALRELAK